MVLGPDIKDTYFCQGKFLCGNCYELRQAEHHPEKDLPQNDEGPEYDVAADAEKHYHYTESVAHKSFVDGFVHGYKHGIEKERGAWHLGQRKDVQP
jgi:hypothetical protein